MRILLHIAALLPASLLLACAAPDTQGQAPTPQAGTETATPAPGTGDDLLYRLLVAEIAGQRGQLGVAVDNYLQAAREVRDPAVAERATRIAMFAGAHTKALEAARLWVAYAPESMEAQQVLAIELIRAGEADEALQHLNTVLKATGSDPEQGYLIIAGLLGREHDATAALEVMRRLVAKHPQDPNAHFALAQLALRLDQSEASLAAVDEALRLRADWPEAIAVRTRILQQLDRTDEALGDLERVLKRLPKNRELRLTYARLLVQTERLDDARREFETVAKQAPEDADALFALGLLALQREALSEAEKYFNRLIKLNKNASEAYFYLGQVAEARKDSAAAIRAYTEVKQGSNYLDAQIRIAALMAAAGQIDAARSHLHGVAVRSAEQQLRLYLVEGELLRDAGQLQAAMDVYDGALEELPENPDLLYARALLAEKLDRLDILEADLGLILAKDADNAQALNALGYTLADRTKRYQEALGYIQRALELEPDDPAILDSMGWVQFRLGAYHKAVGYLRRALELNYDSEIAAHLGEVLWVQGDHEQALQVWRKALKKTPDDAKLRDVMQRLTGKPPK